MNQKTFVVIELNKSTDTLNQYGTRIHDASVIASLNIESVRAFVFTPAALIKFLNHNNLLNQIRVTIQNLTGSDPHQLTKASAQIQKLIQHHPFDKHLLQEIKKSIKPASPDSIYSLHLGSSASSISVSSYKPQLAKGESVLLVTIRSMWAHLFTPSNIITLKKQPSLYASLPAILIKQMPPVDISGTIDTRFSQSKDHSLIQAFHGLDPSFNMHHKTIIPHEYIVERRNGKIINKRTIKQQEMVAFDRFGHLIVKKTPQENSATALLSDKELVTLSQWGRTIQNHFLAPHLVTWIKTKNQLFIYSTQISQGENQIPAVKKPPQPKELTKNLKQIIKGTGASMGIISAPVRIIKDPTKRNTIKSGEIIVSPYISSQLLSTMRKAVGLISNQGGTMSHAAIVARELGIPAVVAAKNATNILKNGSIITINGKSGSIFQGGLPSYHTLFTLPEEIDSFSINYPEKTATKLMLNISSSHSIDRWSHLIKNGIGALRGDLILAEFGIHPAKIKSDNKISQYSQHLTKEILNISKHIPKEPILFHASDLTTSHFSMLIGGSHLELTEQNPILGFRGATRVIIDPFLFELELNAIKKVRQKYGIKNLHLVLPSVRNRAELHQLKRLCAASGLSRSSTFNIYVPIHNPVNVYQIPEYAKEGVDGILIKLNTLSAISLGIDSNNQEVNHLLNTNEPAIKTLLKHVINESRQKDLKTVAYGHLLAKDSPLIDNLVKWGIWAITVDPLTFNASKYEVSHAEANLLKQIKQGIS